MAAMITAMMIAINGLITINLLWEYTKYKNHIEKYKQNQTGKG